MTEPKKRLLKALHREPVDRPPFWLMRQAGRYLPEYREIRRQAGGFFDMCYTPELAVEITLQPLRRFAMDAAILFSDILVIPHALGRDVSFVEGRGPVLDPLRDARDIPEFRPERFHVHLAPVYRTVSSLAQALDRQTALIGFAGAPWTVATYMVEGGSSRDFATVKKWAYTAPDEFGKLLDVLTEATIEYLSRQIEHGAEVVQLFDTWAGVLPDGAFERCCIEPVARIRAALKQRHPDIPVIAFPRGIGVRLTDYAMRTEIDALSLDWTVPRGWANRELQPDIVVQGNLDPAFLVAGGPSMESEIGAILDSFGRAPFVFNLGHGIVPETPPDNVARLAEIVRNWRPT